MKIPQPWTVEEMRAAHAVTASGRPYLYLASSLLADPLPRTAFEVAYASMRGVDDAVDERAAGSGGPELRAGVTRWLERARAARRGERVAGDVLQGALATLFRVCELPFEPWERLGAALLEDLSRDGFETLDEFLVYSEGVAVGPGRLFAMLMSAAPAGDRHVPHPASHHPAFAELARFTYLVHGLRDLARDLEGPMRGTALAPRAELRAAGLDPAAPALGPAAARNGWVLSVAGRARAMRRRAGDPWRLPGQEMPSGAAFVLAFLVALYERQLGRIESLGGDVFSDAHRMGPGDVLETAQHVVSQYTGAPQDWRERLQAELGDGAAPRA